MIDLREFVEEVRSRPDPIVADHLLKLLAERTGTTLDALRRTMREIGREGGEAANEP